jgi:hypothetical protein
MGAEAGRQGCVVTGARTSSNYQFEVGDREGGGGAVGIEKNICMAKNASTPQLATITFIDWKKIFEAGY